MKLLNRLSVTAAIVSTLAFGGCKDDVYDPNKAPEIPSQDNPLGDGFTAPAGFNWSMIGAVKVNVEVKDEFNGEFNYLIEIFTNNPLANEEASPIAAGYASKNGNYSAEITIPNASERIYIRQTDPKQRKEIYEYEVPENGNITCKLYFAGSNTKAVSNSTTAYIQSIKDGYIEPKDENLEEAAVFANVPNVSDAPFESQNSHVTLQNNSKFIIGTEYTANNPFKKDIQTRGGRASVYVKGVWELSSETDNIDIYILDGGKIVNSGNIFFDATTTLAIHSGGSVETSYDITIHAPNSWNFGTIKAKKLFVETANESSYPNFFEKGKLDITCLALTKAHFFNHTDLECSKIDLINGNIINKAKISITSGDINYNGGYIFNYGSFLANTNQGNITTNSNKNSCIVNHDQAIFKGHDIVGGLYIYNDGFIEVQSIDASNTGDNHLYNSCTFIATKKFKFSGEIILDKGSITGGQDKNNDQVWVAVPTFISDNEAKIYLRNGSMIKSNNFTCGSNLIIDGGNYTDKSMIQAGTITYEWTTLLKGNLVLSVNKEINAGSIEKPWEKRYKKEVSVVSTGYDESKYTIETCGGFYNPGNPGEEPFNPEIPTINDATQYTYVFEDNWPAYGDYDLNDLVLTLTDRKIEAKDGKTTASFKIRLNAVGANKQLGAGIRFLKLTSDKISSLKVDRNQSSVPATSAVLESGQDLPTILLFDNAHAQYGYTDSKPFINTTTGLIINEVPTFTISFQSNISKKDLEAALNINNLDVFIVNEPLKNGKRFEVHLPGYAPTSLCNTNVFGSSDDASKEKGYYLSKNGLAWAIVIPNSFKWPQERQKIISVYKTFENWIKTSGKEDDGWYNNPTGPVFNPEN